MKRYKLTLPTPERCTALAIKFEGQEVRTRLWLMGLAYGVSLCPGTNRFNLSFTSNTKFYVETNSSMIINNVRDYLEPYGVTVAEQIPNCPICNGERELDGRPGIYYCGHCGMRTT